MYGETKKDLVEIIKKLCEMKQVNLIDGRVCIDYIHMYVAIPPKMSVSEFMLYLKGKSALMLFDRHPEYRNSRLILKRGGGEIPMLCAKTPVNVRKLKDI